MPDVDTSAQSTVNTVKRVIVFQLAPASIAMVGPNTIKMGELPIEYKVTTDADPDGHSGRFEDQVVLDSLVPGTPAKLKLFDTDYELVVRGDVQSDTTKLSWYRQRLYMLGYIDGDELEAAEVDIPKSDGSEDSLKVFHDGLSVVFLDALLAFQVDHQIDQDQAIAKDSDAVKKTRSTLDFEAGM